MNYFHFKYLLSRCFKGSLLLSSAFEWLKKIDNFNDKK